MRWALLDLTALACQQFVLSTSCLGDSAERPVWNRSPYFGNLKIIFQSFFMFDGGYCPSTHSSIFGSFARNRYATAVTVSMYPASWISYTAGLNRVVHELCSSPHFRIAYSTYQVFTRIAYQEIEEKRVVHNSHRSQHPRTTSPWDGERE